MQAQIPKSGRLAAEEAKTEILEQLEGAHMCFVTAGMGGGTGTGAAPIVAELAREQGILTVGVVTKPFHFEGDARYQMASEGVEELRSRVHTLVVLPNQNLFKVTNDATPIGEIFQRANQVLYKGIKSITDLMVNSGLINLDFADVKAILSMEGTAIMGTGEAEGEKRAQVAANEAMDNQLLEDVRLEKAHGVLINVIGGNDMTLLDLQDATETIRANIDGSAKIIVGSVLDPEYDNKIKVTLIATGLTSADEQAGKQAYEDAVEMDVVPEPVEDETEVFEQEFAVPDEAPQFISEAWAEEPREEDGPVYAEVAEITEPQPQLESSVQANGHDADGPFQSRRYVAPKAQLPTIDGLSGDYTGSHESGKAWDGPADDQGDRHQGRRTLKSVLGRMSSVSPLKPRPNVQVDPLLTASRSRDPELEEQDPREIPAFIRRQAN